VSVRRFSSGWATVAVLFVLLVGAVGTQMCFGLFLKPLADGFGWSRAGVSGAMSLLMAVSGVVGVAMGKVTDRFGARTAIAPGILIGTVSYLLVSRVEALWQFYLLFGLGGGILIGCANTPAITSVSRRFGADGRTLAIGVVLLGSIVGQMALSPSISAVIVSFGWRPAWVIMAIVVLVCGLPSIAFLGRSRPGTGRPALSRGADAEGTEKGEEGLSWRGAARTLAFWVLIVTGVIFGLGFSAFSAHIVAYITDTGLSTTTAVMVFTVSSAGMVVGTLVAGAIATKLGDRLALVLLTALDGVVTALFVGARSAWRFYRLAVILGFAFSAVVPIRMGVVSPLFGLRAVGTIVGILSLSFSVGAIGGPFLTGYIFDAAGSYDPAFLIFGGLLLAAALALCFLRVPRAAASAHRAPEAATIWRAGDGLG
jgi:MFS family permease